MTHTIDVSSHDAGGPVASAPPVPAVSIVVPTRNEAGNVSRLVSLLGDAMPEQGFELIFVDDSDDGTDAVVEAEIAARPHQSIHLIHRTGEDRAGGLGSAVVAGMRIAHAKWLCVMDADLQHPPDLVPELLARAAGGDVDIVIASRFCDSGTADEFGRARRILSRGSTLVAEGLFGRQLRDVSDPMSGFFMVRRAAIEIGDLRPHGFKILLEILVRSHGLRVAEVPFSFGVRYSGDSKASAAEGARYLRHIWRLRFKDVSTRFGRFGIVGLSGLVVNTLLLALLTNVLGTWYVAGAILATQGSSLWNFALTDRWVFRSGDRRMSGPRRLASFLAMNNAALLLRIPILLVLVSGVGVDHLAGNVVSLLVLTVARFGIADSWIWAPAGPIPTFNYDIHGIVTVASEGRLPELERFRVDADLPDPTIRVRIGRIAGRGTGATELESGDTRVHFVERFGNLGFGAQIDLGERVEVLATPLLRRSPHVLYTNIVEPVLRWAFVERGHALVHAACMAHGDDAFLITARTDTGKTTTALKTLDNLPYAFMSDDLTLLCPDGRALTYPKPLTISRHTLSAVKRPRLTRKQRMGLVIQSRLHSKSGRLFGLIIARTGLPAATINALVQMIVPPPKFHVDSLVPGVEVASEANVAALVVIQREGIEGSEALERAEALDILLANCEDAYGFPPYPVIESWLHSRDGNDLKAIERSIITRALSDAPGTLLRSFDRNWYEMFPSIVDRAIEARRSPAGGAAVLRPLGRAATS
jgi:glycosyltransferase involved in cell wall biosynthesis